MSMRTVNIALVCPGSPNICHVLVKVFIDDVSPSRAFFPLAHLSQQPVIFEMVVAPQSRSLGPGVITGIREP